jgi:hypothetical protein
MTLPPVPAESDPAHPGGGTMDPAELRELVRQQMAERDALRQGSGAPAQSGKSGMVRVLVGVGLLVVGLIGLYVRAVVLRHNLEFWKYVWLTLPVVIGGGWLGYRLGIGRGLSLGHASGLIISLLGTSYLTGLSSGSLISGSLFGANGVDMTCLLQQQTNCAASAPAQTESPLHQVQRIASNYWHLYGPAGIISAAVVGLVLGIGLALVANRNLRRG